MVSYRDLTIAFRDLGLDGTQPVIAHASLSAFGQVQGGAETIVGALMSSTKSVIMPTFTYKTMVIPKEGPPNNGITYGRGKRQNQIAEFYFPDMQADPLMGIVPETLRQLEEAHRSNHPIYSFSGVNAKDILAAQNNNDPFGPIHVLTKLQGLVLLLGVDHTSNTSIHFAEKNAKRKQFIRWALTPKGVKECPGWPGCSFGFNAVTPHIKSFTQKTKVGEALIQAIPLPKLLKVVVEKIIEDPIAFLCDRTNCQRCHAVRKDLQ